MGGATRNTVGGATRDIVSGTWWVGPPATRDTVGGATGDTDSWNFVKQSREYSVQSDTRTLQYFLTLSHKGPYMCPYKSMYPFVLTPNIIKTSH